MDQFRWGGSDEQAEMRSALENWSNTIDPKVLLRVPPVPDGVGNRMRDNWLPLLQIAQLAGVSWVENAMMPFKNWRLSVRLRNQL